MMLSRIPKLAVAAALCSTAAAPGALASPTHQTPVAHHATHVTRNALTRGAWTPMVDESRLDPPFGQPGVDNVATQTWLQNRP
jgi:hypothetical protein